LLKGAAMGRFPMIDERRDRSLSFVNSDQDCFKNGWIQFLSQISLFDLGRTAGRMSTPAV
jgi:hypothetical protein